MKPEEAKSRNPEMTTQKESKVKSLPMDKRTKHRTAGDPRWEQSPEASMRPLGLGGIDGDLKQGTRLFKILHQNCERQMYYKMKWVILPIALGRIFMNEEHCKGDGGNLKSLEAILEGGSQEEGYTVSLIGFLREDRPISHT